jgi:hypothetical protein
MTKQVAWAIWVALAVWTGSASPVRIHAQEKVAQPHRTRLILKDGSYQMVMSYQVVGKVVRYASAERDGETEEIPLSLVDLEATKRWEKQHFGGDKAGDGQDDAQARPAIDPELLKEEEERKSLTPEVAPELRLPERESVLALDTWRGTPELVPLTQSAGDLSHTTSHNILKKAINPQSSSHQIVQLRGEKADVQLHVDRPAIYLRVGDVDETVGGGTPFVVDTGGSDNRHQPEHIVAATSTYVVVRTDVRTDARVIMSFQARDLGTERRQEDVVETTAELLPGGHWLKVTPKESLLIGEYALMEVVSPKEVNLAVWDFGVHPTRPENKDALKPEPKRPFALEHRRGE